MEYTSNYQLRKPVIGVDLADIRDLNRNMDKIDAVMNASQNSLAPAYDISSEYNTGDVVMYEMLMYECLDDGVTGNWDATKWQRTTAGEHGGGGGSGNVDDVYENGVSVVDPLDHIARVKSYKVLTQSEYDALPASKLTDGIMYCISDSGPVEGDQFAPVIYSLEEREIGTWIDGKPLYTKTISLNNLSGDTNTYTTTSIGIEKCINVEGMMKLSSTGGNQWVSLPYIENGSYMASVKWQEATGDILMYSNWGMTDAIFTLYYTKTTDTPGSGEWTPSGVPAHHYSTDEQVVGTWVDGSTLYEKTFNNLNVTINGNNWINLVQIPNVNMCISIDAYSNDSIVKKCSIAEIQYYNEYIQVSGFSGYNRTIATATIRYTKTA